jgi:formylmethanofuran--tetrahydromethanopterin N-formyltransferase
MPDVTRNGVVVRDTFAEAFDMVGTALVVTAPSRRWAMQAAITMTGFATSIIACGVEAGIDREISPNETPDGRTGVRVLLCAGSVEELQKQATNRVGQCVLTSPGSACYAGIDGKERIKVGDALRYFADGWQISKRLGGKRYWRLPVMDGEFVCESSTGLTRDAVGGGNLILMGRKADAVLLAAETAVAAMGKVADAITPFPGGIVRSGSKVGSRYKGLFASSNDAYCPTLRGVTKSELEPDATSVLEIVIDGLTSNAVANAMRAGLAAATELGPERGAAWIGAGNYGGNLGRHHYKLIELLA